MYQIFADEVLGSGQFGIVYGGTLIFCCPQLPVHGCINLQINIYIFLIRQTQKVRKGCSGQSHRQASISHQAGESAEE